MDKVCYFDFIYNKISEYRKLIFKELCNNVKSGDILDLGCGTTGYYYALGYIHKIHSVSFYDISRDFIQETETKINEITPDKIESLFSSTVEFLHKENIIPSEISYEELANNLLEKTNKVAKFNFLKDQPIQEYDSVLCIESIECVDTEQELRLALDTVYKLLKMNGQFLGVILPNDITNKNLSTLVERKLEGWLNPSSALFEKNIREAGFKKSIIYKKKTGIPLYPEAIFFQCYK